MVWWLAAGAVLVWLWYEFWTAPILEDDEEVRDDRRRCVVRRSSARPQFLGVGDHRRKRWP